LEALRIEENKILLTTNEVADLYRTSVRTVRNWIKTSKMQSIIQITGKGQGGVTHMIPLTSLDDRRQMKYWKKTDAISSAQAPEDVRMPKQLDEYSKAEREVIHQWMRAINEWLTYRSSFKGQMAVVDQDWVQINHRRYKDISLSVDNLYRKWKALRNNDYDGLIDKRGKWAKGKNSIPEVAWEVFKNIYLDEQQNPITECYKYMQIYFEKELPELSIDIPGYDTFYRAAKTIPYAVVKYFREGDKAFEDDAAPYITRMYEDIEVGEVWVADSHTLDIMTIDNGTQKVHRLTVISFMDVRSRVITGWHITNNPSSEGVLYALRKGILKFGIPRYIYVDNGNEFLCFDIGGRGHRTKKNDNKVHIPPGVFERLGITMWNAQVRNAKAKTIERTHREFKDKFSRIIKGFCGGNPLEKPENLKKTLKSRKGMLLDSELIENFGLYIEGMYNETESNGMGMHGRSPIEVYNVELVSRRTATADELSLMLMRSTRMQKVGRKGVHLEISGEKLHYWSSNFIMQYQGKEVYLRYDPEDLREVRVYNEQDAFLTTVQADDDTILKYGAAKDDVKKALSKIRSFKKSVKEYNDNSILETMPKINLLDLMLWQSKNNIAKRKDSENAQAKVLEVVRANEPLSPESQQDEEVEVDLQRMIHNSRQNAI
jgi:hypothetical protein